MPNSMTEKKDSKLNFKVVKLLGMMEISWLNPTNSTSEYFIFYLGTLLADDVLDGIDRTCNQTVIIRCFMVHQQPKTRSSSTSFG